LSTEVDLYRTDIGPLKETPGIAGKPHEERGNSQRMVTLGIQRQTGKGEDEGNMD